MKNYKNLAKILFLCSSLILASCSGSKSKNKKSDANAIAFFENIQIKEQNLKQKYGFYSVLYNDGTIRQGNVLNRRHLRLLADFYNASVREVKSAFFEDMHAYTSLYNDLQIGQVELERYNSELYHEYSYKLFRLGQHYNKKRERFYSRQNRRVEKEEERKAPEVRIPVPKKKKEERKKEIFPEEDTGKRKERKLEQPNTEERQKIEDLFEEEDLVELPPAPGGIEAF